MTSQRTELIRFCLVGAGGYAVNTAAFAGSIALGGQELTAATTAFAAAVAVNFWCNRRWTFHATDDSAGRQALRFFAVSIAAFLVGAAVLQLLIDLGHVPSLPAQGASIALATPVNFLGNKAWAFADQAPLARPLAAETAPSTWLVLPTYNEAENLEPFVRSVLPQLAQATSEHHLLIVDDSSPDGTGEIADRLAAELDRVHVLHRAEKDGLGRAYVAGFRRALDEGAQLVLQMDADFSHDPASVPELIAAARDADLVLGSRYVAGGGTVDWGLGRRLLSRGGSWYARTVLGVPVRDLTGGFKCWRRELLERLGVDELGTAGFGFQIETTYRGAQGRRAGVRGADPLPRPPGRQLEDERADRARGADRRDRPQASVRQVRDPVHRHEHADEHDRQECDRDRQPHHVEPAGAVARGHRLVRRRRGLPRRRREHRRLLELPHERGVAGGDHRPRRSASKAAGGDHRRLPEVARRRVALGPARAPSSGAPPRRTPAAGPAARPPGTAAEVGLGDRLRARSGGCPVSASNSTQPSA